MQTAAALFDYSDVCHADGHKSIPLDGSYSEPWQEPAGPTDEAGAADATRRKLAGRDLLKKRKSKDAGSAVGREHVARAHEIHDATVANLRRTGWLGEFEPMLHTCPLTARKVSAEAVSDFASVAWRCDGLGFAFKCLRDGDVGEAYI